MSSRPGARCISFSRLSAVSVCALLVAATALSAAAAGPMGPRGTNAVSASVRAVQPAVSALFQVQAPRVWADSLDESGAARKNGVPDFLDTWEGFRSRTSSAIVKNGYAFSTIDRLQHEILYAGVRSESFSGPSLAVIEFSQTPGERSLGDLRITAEIDSVGVGAVRFETLAGEAKGAAKFVPVALLVGIGCNDEGSACVAMNGAVVEFGYNLTVLGKPAKSFAEVRFTTPDESTLGTMTLVPVTLPSATCPSNLNSCTASDVTTTVKSVTIRNNDLCENVNDTIDLRITTAYAATSNERYDLGLFVSGDGGTVREPSTANVCFGAAAQAGQGDINAYADADTDLWLSIDPSGHASTPSTTDTCGDLRSTAGPVDWTVDVAVKCNIVNNTLRIPSCRVWEQNANHKVSCQTLQQAGTGSKCDCTDLVVTSQLNPCATKVCGDDNPCAADSCVVSGTAPDLVGTCVHTPVANGTACGDQTSGDCKVPDTCQAGTCQTGFASATTICRPSAGQCDAAESCTGTSATCPANAFASATTACTGASNGGPCDGTDSCSGTANTCVDGFKSSTTTCREAAGQCDVAESCNGTSGACPANGFASSTTACTGTSNGGPCDGTDSCSGTANTCVDGFKSSTTTCRPSAGQCDVAESCNGTSGACPANGFATATTACTGTSNGGPCDGTDSCSGTANTCVDGFRSATTTCRVSAGICDRPESCTGTTGACPDNAFYLTEDNIQCRAAGNECDAPEICDGSGPNCPADYCGERKPRVDPYQCIPPSS